MEKPYEGYRLYGPYVHSYTNRKIVYLRKLFTKEKVYLNYARYLMEIHLGRRLSPQEDVHHVNGDKTDDRLENLEVIHRAFHSTNHGKNRTDLIRNGLGQFR